MNLPAFSALSGWFGGDYPVRRDQNGFWCLQFDSLLLVFSLALFFLGWVMVSTASLDYAQQNTGDMFYFCKRHGIYLLMSLCIGAAVLKIPYRFWRQYHSQVLLLAIFLLAVVLVPGIGRRVNGSQRWISLGFITLQVSEFAKCASMIYFSSYLVRKRENMQQSVFDFAKPFLVLGVLAAFLLKEPDFGATVVIAAATMALLFVAGAPLVRFVALMLFCVVAAGFIAVKESYRMKRLLAFVDPWDSDVVYGSGYQLTQSLIAIGRGEWLGVGLGHSVQKLFYLPEAHTDFVFSIWAEETGLAGCVVVIALFTALVWRMLAVAREAFARGERFGALVVTGMGFLIAFQAFINMGVASGLLPTKGLTLPYISYGGSSMLISAAMSALVLRLSYENRRGEFSGEPESEVPVAPVKKTGKKKLSDSQDFVKTSAAKTSVAKTVAPKSSAATTEKKRSVVAPGNTRDERYGRG